MNTVNDSIMRHSQGRHIAGQSAVAPAFIPTLTSLEPKSNAQRLAEYRIKYMALTCKEAA